MMVKHGIKKNKKAHFLSRFIKATSDFFSSKKEFVEGKLEEQEEDIWINIFSFIPSFKQYRDYQVFQLRI